MKKYTICIAALLLVAGIANAQSLGKKPTTTATTPNSNMISTKPSTHAIQPVSQHLTPASSTQKQVAGNTGIKRKHIRKKKTSLPKTTNK